MVRHLNHCLKKVYAHYCTELVGHKIARLNRKSFFYLRASLCKILISSFADKIDFAHNFSVDFFK